MSNCDSLSVCRNNSRAIFPWFAVKVSRSTETIIFTPTKSMSQSAQNLPACSARHGALRPADTSTRPAMHFAMCALLGSVDDSLVWSMHVELMVDIMKIVEARRIRFLAICATTWDHARWAAHLSSHLSIYQHTCCTIPNAR